MRFVSILTIVLAMTKVSPAADLPSEIHACLKTAGPGYTALNRIDPPYFTADFDGDGKPDHAVLVKHGPEQGIVVCRGGAAAPVVLGAGIVFNEMSNLDFTAWRTHAKSHRVERGAGQGRLPVLSGDALVLEWESASAVVYWNGKRFLWYQQGD